MRLKADEKLKDGWAHTENMETVEGMLAELHGALHNDRHEKLMDKFEKQQLELKLERIVHESVPVPGLPASLVGGA